MKTIEVQFPSGELTLEGVLALPEGRPPFPAVIVCHPHPQYGGSMDNNVVNAVCEALAAAAMATLKFNFRGVGGSQGSYDGGIGEQADVAAAIDFISGRKEVDDGRIGLAGYSAGAAFSFPVGTGDERVKALAGISPPLAMSDFEYLNSCLKPKLLISGGGDNFTGVKHFLSFCEGLPEPKECAIIDGADHFWGGYEEGLAAKVAAFFAIRVGRPAVS